MNSSIVDRHKNKKYKYLIKKKKMIVHTIKAIVIDTVKKLLDKKIILILIK
ncbi:MULTISPECIES: hypothetical protein [Clostridium]|uniref:hypothetical protein n=1 Tax=Clostridium TaxID=1485 RepID=UPI000AB7B153|nr:hypothetical protein [Clostridium sporogenes]